jgi:hypothetical protein
MAEELEQLGHGIRTEVKDKLLEALSQAIADFDRAIQLFYH